MSTYYSSLYCPFVLSSTTSAKINKSIQHYFW